jgi:hypothetical protein
MRLKNSNVGNSIPPLGTILQIVSQLQTVISGPRNEGRLLVLVPFVPVAAVADNCASRSTTP